MRIVFDRDDLRLDVVPGDPLHPDALETWREACELSKTCIDVLPSDEADATCNKLAEIATRALTTGRDAQVIADFRKAKRKILDADEALRKKSVNLAFKTSLINLAVGFAAGIVWLLVEPYAPWGWLPRGMDLAANYVLLVLGWAGFTLVGFSIGWLFQTAAVVRIQSREDTVKLATALRQRRAHVVYSSVLCVIIVIAMFFFDGFAKINEELSIQLTSAPWAILLGLIAGIAESAALFERIRDFFKLS